MTDDSTQPSLAELATATGVEARTIRSWVAQGLVPGPTSRGPLARYPAGTLERLRAILGMREELGMSLPAIRQELLVATPDQLAAYASHGAAWIARRGAIRRPQSSALDYLRHLDADRLDAPAPPAGVALMSEAVAQPSGGFEALERRLAGHARPPQRKARAEPWLRIPITPDVELAVRGPLDAEQRARLERCADLVRDILVGKDR